MIYVHRYNSVETDECRKISNSQNNRNCNLMELLKKIINVKLKIVNYFYVKVVKK